ncbi:MAG: hypothetical protein JW999_11475 [Methanotrichaceae archaeon]|nr:hypothetical protein [Methanotrichaceae archaeon]
MVKTALVDKYINDGRDLIAALEKEGISIDTAMWFYSEELDEWQLMIATQLVDQIGLRETLRRAQSIIRDMTSISLSLSDISILSPNSNLINAIKNTVGRSKDITLRGTVANGILVNDAYIYCVA